eukprot:3805167-Pyramimonas_sp.AAC.1
MYNAALSACERADTWERARAVYGDMQAQGVEPCTATFEALLEVYSRNSRWEEALEVCQRGNGG